MSTQELGADGGYITVVIGGPMELLPHFTQIRKVKNGVTVYPGLFVSGAGETAGEVDLAAAGDEDTSYVEIVLEEEVGPNYTVDPKDGTKRIDIGIVGSTTTPRFVKTLRNTGLFKVACIRADESSTLEEGQLMALEATGHLKAWAYTDTAEATDTHILICKLAAASADVAGTDPVIEAWF
jgi:hypothetical protein